MPLLTSAIPLHKQPAAHAPAVTLSGTHGPNLSNAAPLIGLPIKAPMLITNPNLPISSSVDPIAR